MCQREKLLAEAAAEELHALFYKLMGTSNNQPFTHHLLSSSMTEIQAGTRTPYFFSFFDLGGAMGKGVFSFLPVVAEVRISFCFPLWPQPPLPESVL